MGNMSYCRWRNTKEDFRDCYESLDEFLVEISGKSAEKIVESDDDNAREELAACYQILKMCRQIVEEYPDAENELEAKKDRIRELRLAT